MIRAGVPPPECGATQTVNSQGSTTFFKPRFQNVISSPVSENCRRRDSPGLNGIF